MEQRFLGTTGMKVPLVGLGCNVFGSRIDEAQAGKLVDRAFDLGTTFFDTADSYGGPDGVSERILGAALKGRRDGAIVASKAGLSTTEAARGPMGASRRYLTWACEQSLRRLGTDRIDLYQIHTPDRGTPIEETLRALEDLQRAGKIVYYGASNLRPWQIVDAAWTARHHGISGYVSVQNEYHLLARNDEADLFASLDAAGPGLIPYFPLASGLLTGKYRKGQPLPPGARFAEWAAVGDRFLTPANLDAVERLSQFVEARGRTLVELAMSWLASKRQVSTIIASATRVEQLDQNAAAVGWTLTADEIAEAERLAGHDEEPA